MAELRQGNSPDQLVLSVTKSAVIVLPLEDGMMQHNALGGALDAELTQVETSFIQAVADCFNGFDETSSAALRLRVLIGMLEEFRLNHASESSST